MKPFVSIVVPVYNVEKELPRCVDSILHQTFSDWELLLIDDGSSDRSANICDEYNKQNNRIKVFHKQNEGVSETRNLGIEKSEGEWITFIDSDDFITPNFLRLFADTLKQQSFDLFMGDVRQIGLNGSSFVEFRLPDTTCDLKEATISYKLLRSGDLHGKVFHRSLMDNGLRFCKNVKYSEDGIFFYNCLARSKKIYLCSNICYCYKRNPEGLSYKLNSFVSEHEGYEEHKKVLRQIGERINIDYRTLLHLSPIERVMHSAVLELDSTNFLDFCKRHDASDVYFFLRYLKVLRFGDLFSFLYLQKHFHLLYRLLKVYYSMKK